MIIHHHHHPLLLTNPSSRLDTSLETDPLYLPGSSTTTTDPTTPSPGQQILSLSFERNRAVRNAIADYSERCERVSQHSSSALYTECVEYDVLRAHFGRGVLAPVMVQYARDEASGTAGRFWYELLHELAWGHKTGLQTIVMGDMYRRWADWFQEGAAEAAPKFGGEAA